MVSDAEDVDSYVQKVGDGQKRGHGFCCAAIRVATLR